MRGDAAPRVAWFHCFSGIAGDMALGSLLDAGADRDQVEELLRRLELPGWSLRCTATLRGGLACTRAEVVVEESAADGAPTPTGRPAGTILDLLDRAGLPERVRARSRAVFERLASVEGRLHGVTPERVHFHEVGGHDAVIDVVGTAAALESLGVDEIRCSAVATGVGTLRAAHGILPNPPPAVVRLLEGAPVRGLEVDRELTTPTGAAIVAALGSGFGPLPEMVVERSGFGAGRADPDDLPNCTQVVIGRGVAAGGIPDGQPLVELSANLDDATGEDLAESLRLLLASGALDAWTAPVVMKKGRPGHVVHALADPADLTRLRDVLRVTTGSLGVRAAAVTRWPLRRTTATVKVHGGTVRLKVTSGRVKAEHDDLVALSAATGVPVRELRSLAEEAWRRLSGQSDGANE